MNCCVISSGMIMQIKYLYTIFLSLFLTTIIFSQNLSISGTIPGGESSVIRLSTYDDYVSYRIRQLSEIITSDSGFFTLTAELVETKLVFLEMEHYSIGLYVEQDGHYVLEFDSIKLVDEYRPLYNREQFPCWIASEPEPGLNNLISNFNTDFNTFIGRELGGIYQKRNTNILKDLKTQVEEKYGIFDVAFLDQYMAYKIAGVEIAMAPAKKPTLFQNLIKDKPVLLNHPEYMAFFHSFYDKHLYPDNRQIPRIDLYTTINYQPSYSSLMDSLGKDSTLRNERIRELVCINLLGELYPSPDFSKAGILKILDHIQLHSKFRENLKIAGNVKFELTRLEKGFEPPAILLNDLNGKLVSISDFRGKPTYINFFTTWSSGCLVELELMNALKEEYKNSINFISISLDKNTEIVNELIVEKDYDWIFLFNGTDPGLVHNYRIKTFPVFLLLDQQGKLVDYPAFKPSEIIRETFDRQLGRK